jgi:hypothetical protein
VKEDKISTVSIFIRTVKSFLVDVCVSCEVPSSAQLASCCTSPSAYRIWSVGVCGGVHKLC